MKHAAFIDNDISTGNRLMAAWLNSAQDTLWDAIGDGTNPPTTHAQVLSNLSFSQAVVYAAASAGRKFQRIVNVADAPYSAVGDGVTDDSPAFLAAATALGATGGTITMPNSFKCLIDTNLNLTALPNITIQGNYGLTGTPGNNVAAPYGNMGSALIVNSAATITLGSGSGIQGCLIYRKGMAFPAANSAAYAGVAVTAGGDDTYLSNCLLLGFATAYLFSNHNRCTHRYVSVDCLTGFDISTSTDSVIFDSCRGWPYATVAAGTNTRSGSFIRGRAQVDGLEISNCFSYGYLNGLRLNTVSDALVTNSFFDSTGAHASSIGINLETNVTGCQFNNIQVSSYARAYVQAANAGERNSFNFCAAYQTTGNGFDIATGDADIFCPLLKTIGGIGINIGTGDISIVAPTFLAVTGNDVDGTALTNTSVRMSGPVKSDKAAGTTVIANYTAATLASATALALPASSACAGGIEVFHVSGNTAITSITGGYCGRHIKLIFDGTPTLTDGSNLQLAGNFVASAQDSWVGTYDGTVWNEDCRSVN